MSDSVQHHRRQPTRLPCSWDSPGKNAGVGCHCLLQCMKVKIESEVIQSCLDLWIYLNSSSSLCFRPSLWKLATDPLLWPNRFVMCLNWDNVCQTVMFRGPHLIEPPWLLWCVCLWHLSLCLIFKRPLVCLLSSRVCFFHSRHPTSFLIKLQNETFICYHV